MYFVYLDKLNLLIAVLFKVQANILLLPELAWLKSGQNWLKSNRLASLIKSVATEMYRK